MKQLFTPAHRFRTVRGFLIIGALFLMLDLGASLMNPLTIAELSKESNLIVRGEVISKTCERDAQGRIYTQIELDVREVWKGTLKTNKLTIVQGGGVLGEESVVVSGQVQYDMGEEVVVFIVYNGAHEAVTLGMTQGKFHLERPKNSSQVYVHNPFHGQPIPTGRNPSEMERESKSPAGIMTVEDLKSKVLASK
jgi:hypothetical protein